MSFELDIPKIPQLERETIDGVRHYVTPEGKKYPSVTTVTKILNAKAIAEWRKRVGEKEATRVSTKASTRGTRIHKALEKLCLNEEYTGEMNLTETLMYKSAQGLLEKNLGIVRGVETFLYSDYLRVGGQVDLVGQWDGKYSIIDFKTAAKPKKEHYIHNYFMQGAAYAVMWEERTKQPINQIIILVAVQDEPPQVFIQKRDDWIQQFINLREDYDKTNQIKTKWEDPLGYGY